MLQNAHRFDEFEVLSIANDCSDDIKFVFNYICRLTEHHDSPTKVGIEFFCVYRISLHSIIYMCLNLNAKCDNTGSSTNRNSCNETVKFMAMDLHTIQSFW